MPTTPKKNIKQSKPHADIQESVDQTQKQILEKLSRIVELLEAPLKESERKKIYNKIRADFEAAEKVRIRKLEANPEFRKMSRAYQKAKIILTRPIFYDEEGNAT